MLLPVTILWMATRIVATITFPATVEVDLIFPHNETYAPSSLPIVFAFQNSALAPSLDPGLSVTLWDLNSNTTHDVSLDLKNANFSGSDPLFVYRSVANLTASTYRLVWGFSHGNCSAAQTNGPTFDNDSNFVLFTIKDGAPQPDFAGSLSSVCADFTHFAFNVTGTQAVGPNHFDGRDTCAILSDVQPTVSGSPCAVQVSKEAASSISSALSGHTATSTSKPSAAARGGDENVGLAVVAVLIGLVAAVTTL